MKTTGEIATLLESIQKSLLSAGRHAPGEVPPAVILWPDADAQWQSLIPQLKTLMPHLFILGQYSPGERRGPAIWLRCVIDRALPEVSFPPQSIPVIYLPGIGRQLLRSVEECPTEVLPLVELQFRGTVWCQRHGKDWTVESFLASEEGGLELDIAKDLQTRRALLGALPQLAVTSVSRFQGKRLEAEDFDRLMIEDTPRNLLEWMDDPNATKERWSEGGVARWSAFRARCKAEYGFDPQTDDEIAAGEHLGLRDGAWLGVWQRFVESPTLYPKLPDLLRKAKPAGSLLLGGKETWPDENDEAEKALRITLTALADRGPGEARTVITGLEAEHGVRRNWVWAKLGQSPLATAMKHLAALATATSNSLGGDSPDAMANFYASGGYLADDALLRSLASVKSADDCDAITAAARAVYLPWAQDSAEHFQKLASGSPLPAHSHGESEVNAESGTCILFVDGLRFDIGQRLSEMGKDRHLRVTQGRRWAAVPTVTATAKPAVSPAANQIVGHHLGEDFAPDLKSGGQPATSDRVKKLLASSGYQCMTASDTGQPMSEDARAWSEYGQFDKLGHDLQVKLAGRVEDQLDLLIVRIESLLAAGWKVVRVVTDHGWLLMPGGLPTVSLPKFLTACRWSRCAAIKPGAHVSAPVAGWYWNSAEMFAFGPGISCFGEGYEYSHGGLSLQECVVPDLMFSTDSRAPEVTVTITSIQWAGLRCRIGVDPPGAAVTLDLRTKAGDPATSLTRPRPSDPHGKTALLVEDDSREGVAATVVILDASGRVVAKKATTVGGEE